MDELARCGLRYVVTCPGSRNAPLILAVTSDRRLECVSVIDERSAGYVALGIAKASGRPVAVTPNVTVLPLLTFVLAGWVTITGGIQPSTCEISPTEGGPPGALRPSVGR